MDGARREIWVLRGDLIATGDRQRAQWCDTFARNPVACGLPEAQAAHPLAECAYRPAKVAAHLVTRLACSKQSGWQCAAEIAMPSCLVTSPDGGSAPSAACDVTAAHLAQAWGAERRAQVAVRLAQSLDAADQT